MIKNPYSQIQKKIHWQSEQWRGSIVSLWWGQSLKLSIIPHVSIICNLHFVFAQLDFEWWCYSFMYMSAYTSFIFAIVLVLLNFFHSFPIFYMTFLGIFFCTYWMNLHRSLSIVRKNVWLMDFFMVGHYNLISTPAFLFHHVLKIFFKLFGTFKIIKHKFQFYVFNLKLEILIMFHIFYLKMS